MKKQVPQKNKWQRIRKVFNDIHLWLGLTSGLVVIAVCLSGTLYVFNSEITEWGAPHLYKVEHFEGQQRLTTDSLRNKVELFAGGKVTRAQIPAAEDRTYQFSVSPPGARSPRQGVTYFVNPYNGEITGTSKDPNGAREFMSTMFSLHRWLLLDKVEKPIINGIENRNLGSMITGWATILFTLGCITGLVIWFPQRLKSWKQGLKIKWGAGWKRVNHDLHNTLAFYSLFFLLMMGLTGPQWSFSWYRTGLQKTLGTYKPPQEPAGEKGRTTGAGKQSETKGETIQRTRTAEIEHEPEQTSDSTTTMAASIEKYIRTTDSLLSYTGNYLITLPTEPGANTVVTKTKAGFFAPAAGDRITLTQDGQLVKRELFRDKPVNERIAGSIRAIHVGSVYGTFTKILYFLACLVATSLPVTGTLIWLNKMKKRKRKGKKDRTVLTPAAAMDPA